MGTQTHPINKYDGSFTTAFDAWHAEGVAIIDRFEAYDDLLPADLERCEVMLSYAGTDPADICDMMEQADPFVNMREEE